MKIIPFTKVRYELSHILKKLEEEQDFIIITRYGSPAGLVFPYSEGLVAYISKYLSVNKPATKD